MLCAQKIVTRYSAKVVGNILLLHLCFSTLGPFFFFKNLILSKITLVSLRSRFSLSTAHTHTHIHQSTHHSTHYNISLMERVELNRSAHLQSRRRQQQQQKSKTSNGRSCCCSHEKHMHASHTQHSRWNENGIRRSRSTVFDVANPTELQD